MIYRVRRFFFPPLRYFLRHAGEPNLSFRPPLLRELEERFRAVDFRFRFREELPRLPYCSGGVPPDAGAIPVGVATAPPGITGDIWAARAVLEMPGLKNTIGVFARRIADPPARATFTAGRAIGAFAARIWPASLPASPPNGIGTPSELAIFTAPSPTFATFPTPRTIPPASFPSALNSPTAHPPFVGTPFGYFAAITSGR